MANGSRRGSERVLGSGHLIGIFLGMVVLCCVFFTLGYVMGHSQDSGGRLSSIADSDPGGAPSGEVVPAERASSSRPAGPGSDAAQPPPGSGEWNFSSSRKNETPGNGAGTAVTPGSAPASGNALSVSPSDAAQPDSARPGGSGASAPASPELRTTPTPPLSANPSSGSPLSATASPARPPSGMAVNPAPKFAAPVIPKGALVLQVAALQSESDALAMTSVLQKKSFPAFVLRPGTDKLYRVQVGPYKIKAEAIQARKSLEREGFQPIFKH
jgi:DedD protein